MDGMRVRNLPEAAKHAALAIYMPKTVSSWIVLMFDLYEIHYGERRQDHQTSA